MKKIISRIALTESIGELMDQAGQFLAMSGIDDRKRLEIELALEEILVNIVDYAYQGEAEIGNIECLFVEKKCTGVHIEISDWGKPFNPLKRDDPEIHTGFEEREIGGLGIFLVKKVMDKVRYKREHGKNTLTMEKIN
jgi:anti-sigma regulatory factor (Ser/Thr protein kinase)